MHMPRITVYVPDDLKARMDGAGDDLNWSAITQRAIREAIATHDLKRDPTDMTSVIERLRVSKQRAEEANTASGKECGATWAKNTAEYDELSRVWAAASVINTGIDLAYLQRLIDPGDEMGYQDWQDFWANHGDGDPNDAFAQGFAEGAHDVFEEVRNQL